MLYRAEAFLFDLDGTLINSHAAVERTWGAWARENGLNVAEVLAACHGRRSLDTITKFAPHLPQPQANEAFIDRESSDTEGIVALPGAVEFLRQLPESRWAIVTSCTPKLATARMKAAGIPWPKTMITGLDVSQGKPDPAGFLLAASRLGVKPADALVFEDAPAGVEAGRRAGMRVLTITATHREKKRGEGILEDYRGVRLIARDPLVLEV